MNVEQEIWNDFESLQNSSLLDRISYSGARAHFDVSHQDNSGGLIHRGLNKRLEIDEDYKINKFLLQADYSNVDWIELEKLYPKFIPIHIPDKSIISPPVKFRSKKERLDIENILIKDWTITRENLYRKIPTDKLAKDYLIYVRWDGTPKCPKCESSKIYYLKASNNDYRCAKCRYSFSELSGTIFQNTKMKLLKWYESIALLKSIRTRKISSHQLARILDITQKTAWGVVQKIQSKIDNELILRLFTDYKDKK